MKKFIKLIFRPIAVIFTKLFFDFDTIKPYLKNVYWEENNAFKWASAYIVKNQIKGDYLEFGVWKGNSFIEMHKQIKFNSETFYINNQKKKINNLINIYENMKFHAFDSFEGLPESNYTKPIQYFAGNYAADEKTFLKNINNHGVDLEKVTVTKGWFDKSLDMNCAKNIQLKEIAVAYIDCDLFESTIPVLNFITPFIKTGTILIFDDWFRNGGDNTNGVQGAVLHWLEKNDGIVLQHFHNSDTRTATFIVRKNNKNFNLKNIECV